MGVEPEEPTDRPRVISVSDLYADQKIIEHRAPGPDVAEGGSRTGQTVLVDQGRDETGNREWIARHDTDRELKRLQDKVSLLAMQKNYWQQRSAEHLNACRAAEAEVSRLNEALAESKARLEVTRDVGEPQVPLTVTSF